MNIVLLYCCASILFWTTILFAFYKLKKDALHIGILFILFYLINYPAKMIATQFGFSVINSNLFGKDTQLLAMVLSDIMGVCVVMPLCFTHRHLTQNRNHNLNLSKNLNFAQKKATIVILFIAMLIFLCLANGPDSFKTMFSLDLMKQRQKALSSMRIGSGFSSLLSLMGKICQYIILYIYIFDWKRIKIRWKIFFFLFLIFIMWYGFAMTFSKQTTLFPVLLIILFYNVSSFSDSTKKKVKLQSIIALGALGLIMIAFIGFLRAFRSVSNLQALFNEMFRQFSFAFDAPDNLTAILARMDNIWLGDLHFMPIFLNSLIVFIPRAFWPGKPLLQGQTYIMSYYLQERYSGPLGEVISSSIPGELIVSGGIICMILISILMGCFYSFLYEKAYRNKNSIVSQIIYADSVIALNSFCRSGTATISSLLFFTICLIVFVSFYKLFLNSLSKLKGNKELRKREEF